MKNQDVYRVTVTLIHGTFDTRAQWCDPTSVIPAALRDRLGDRLSIVRFDWSGLNKQADRERAVDDLINHIREHRSHSDRHYIIAHSHGGNIAKWALTQLSHDENAPKVAGLVTISTPFLSIVPMGHPTALIGLVHFAGLMISILFVATWNALLWPQYDKVAVPGLPLLLIGVPLLVLFSTFTRSKAYERKLARAIRRRVARHVTWSVSRTTATPTPTLIIHSRSDEVATMFLGTGVASAAFAFPALLATPVIALATSFVAAVTRWGAEMEQHYGGQFLVASLQSVLIGATYLICAVDMIVNWQQHGSIIFHYMLLPLGASLFVFALLWLAGWLGVVVYGHRAVVDTFALDVRYAMRPPEGAFSSEVRHVEESIGAPKKRWSHNQLLFEAKTADRISEFVV